MTESASPNAGADRPATPPPRKSGWRVFRSVLMIIFGIALPLGTLLFEAVSGMCSQIFFDPVPTIGHGALIALVPLANLLAWMALRGRCRCGLGLLGFLNGAAIAVSGFYALLFLPIVPIALMGFIAIIYFGIGLLAFLPLSPLLSFVCSIGYGVSMRRRLGSGRLPLLWQGCLAGVLLLVACSLPDAGTKIGLRLASSAEPDTRATGIRWLRRLGNESIMLRACYRPTSGPMDLIGWAAFLNNPLTTSEARDIYFRVTGEAFNTRPAPGLWGGRRGRWTGADDFDFDLDQGGEVVAGRLKGLSLSDSRLDGSVDADSATAYLEWTLVFRNTATRQREARAQILLPPGAVVSRLTLWIDGEEREAAFGSRSRVREAYQKVVRRRRDPVLVTTCGPDRILMQCFPVPPNGGEMKTRIGMTVPLLLDDPERGRLLLPQLIERNFRIDAERRHAVWIESKAALSSSCPTLRQDRSGEGVYAVRGELTTPELNAADTGFIVARNPERLQTWAADPHESGYGVLQQIAEKASRAPERIVVVLDGSRRMEPHMQTIADTLKSSLPDTECAVFHAGDAVEMLCSLAAGAELRKDIDTRISGVVCQGGQDNTDALLKAWDLAAEVPRSVILWIHGPQGYLLSAGEPLRQRMERRPNGPVLWELQIEPGPHRLVEKLDGLVPLRHVPRTGTTEHGIASLLRAWREDATTWSAQRQRMTETEIPKADAVEGSRHLVRLWAHDRVMDDYASGDPERLQTAAEVGTRYNIVTPVTGAVVLETQAQYEEAGLEPVAPGSVPTIPEPRFWGLIAVALLAAAAAAARRRAAFVNR